MESHKVTHALEDYLKAIYQLSEEAKPVIAARIAAETGVSASTIFATLRRLAKEGYVTIDRRKEIHLTNDGKKVAERIVRRHFLTERFLTDLLGLDWVKAHQEAHRLEHAISQEVEERLAKLLSNPTTCPHGNPIPGASSSPAHKTMPLSETLNGQDVELDYITEGGERDARLLGFLQDHKLIPGAKLHVLDVAPSLGMMTLAVGQKQFSLGIEAAKKIRVH
ncbi:MAG: metal-dependent transcriptional regulator [Deltaproteobacteria bacterium]|nr:metal-dependent transcriptional regulator [Deltaproteobacteria bacterium]